MGGKMNKRYAPGMFHRLKMNRKRSSAHVDLDKVEPVAERGNKIGRNDPCPCGSERKFKKCCIGALTVQPRHATLRQARQDEPERNKS